jgi:hypothetical protein
MIAGGELPPAICAGWAELVRKQKTIRKKEQYVEKRPITISTNVKGTNTEV